MARKILLTLLALCIIPLFPDQTKAADLSVGATAWYTAWDYEDDAHSDIEYDPSFLYGPVLSTTFTQNLSMSFVFLYGEFDMKMDNGTQSLKRYDSDLTLNYRISDYFKLFAGAKLMGFTWDPDGTHMAVGPGAGISTTIPLGGNFFMLGYLSGMYLRGEEDGTKGVPYKEKANEYGGNGSISLAYYIPSASTTISLGGRYQQLRIAYENNNSGMTPDSTSRFYGITLTAVYSFNI